MYIESVNLGIDLFGTALFQHLGIKFSKDGDNFEIDQMFGQYATFINNLNFVYAGGVDPHYSVDQLAANQSSCIYKSDDGFGRMFAMSGDSYKAISSSVIFGAFKNADSLNTKPYLMAEMINFMLGITTITSVNESVDNETVSVVNYPNPFTKTTTIEFTLKESANVRLNIFDEMGRLVYDFGSEQMSPGKHFKTWNAENQQGNRVKGGFYFYRLTTGENVVSGKFLLMH